MKRKIPFLDLRLGEGERKEILQTIDTIFQHGKIVLGPEVAELETMVAKFCGRSFGVGVSSGTDALFLALKALGIGVGDEVITTSLSWIATTNAIALTGAVPVFVDIGNDLNIDATRIEECISSRTKAILPVHYTGKVCNMVLLMQISEKYGIPIVEDAAQAFGASYLDKKAGSFGLMACFSMNPMKVFGACGEAGMILTDRKDLYEKLIILRYNGTINKEKCIEISLNFRLDTIQAAILLTRFKKLNQTIQKRREIASWYNKGLLSLVEIPQENEKEKDIYYTYTIKTPYRDKLKAFLEENGVETKIQHPFLMPEQEIYQKYLTQPISNAKRLVKQILCLPVHEKMIKEDVQYVISCIERFFYETSSK